MREGERSSPLHDGRRNAVPAVGSGWIPPSPIALFAEGEFDELDAEGEMNKSTRVILLVGAIGIALTWLFPPWVYVSQDPIFSFEGTVGSYFILNPPLPYGARLYLPTLLIQSAAIVLVTCGLILWSKVVSRPHRA